MKRWIAALTVCVIASLAHAADLTSPVGLWKSFDDEGKPSAFVQIYQDGAELKGKVTQVIPGPGKPEHPVCDKCEGDLKGKPVVGMLIMWGMKRDGSEWKSGELLDPKNGKVYSGKIELTDGGRKLKVRGFIGISLIGRTQIWVRES